MNTVKLSETYGFTTRSTSDAALNAVAYEILSLAYERAEVSLANDPHGNAAHDLVNECLVRALDVNNLNK
ncbi:hypothetical protein [Pseudonocardia adelaidensis]|uniref:Uncharacterized protein n=1 Tax=Pseudonocardia adelaidensis TaxID=648754 RepID=A0ABP9NM28_9PSEU